MQLKGVRHSILICGFPVSLVLLNNLDTIFNRRNFLTHLTHPILDLDKEFVQLIFLARNYLVEELFVLLNDRLVVVEVLLF